MVFFFLSENPLVVVRCTLPRRVLLAKMWAACGVCAYVRTYKRETKRR